MLLLHVSRRNGSLRVLCMVTCSLLQNKEVQNVLCMVDCSVELENFYSQQKFISGSMI